MNKLNLSSTPLKNLLKKIEEESRKKGIKDEFFRFSSHPIYKERYDIIDNGINIKENNYDEKLNIRFNFIRGKFFGYTSENINEIEEFLQADYYNYAFSIILSKKGKLKKSLLNLNNLIKNNKENIHLIETKADILYSHGFFSEALLFYNLSIKKNPNNYYVKKRIFDIKFSILDPNDNNKSKALFNEYKYLLNIFYNNQDLKKKLTVLASENNLTYWINYFNIRQNLNNNEYNQNSLLNDLKKIKKNTSDYELIRLIDKIIL